MPWKHYFLSPGYEGGPHVQLDGEDGAEVKRDESHACPGREAGLGTWTANVELEEGALGKRESVS